VTLGPSQRLPRLRRTHTLFPLREAFLFAAGAAVVVCPLSSQERALYRGVPVVLLTGAALTEPNLFVFPNALALVGSRLIILDPGADSLVNIVDNRTGRLLDRLEGVGTGPEQLKSAVAIISNGPNAFSVLDATGRQLITFDFADSSTAHASRRTGGLSLDMGGVVTSAIWSSDTSVVASGFFPGSRFIRVASGRTAVPFGPLTLGDRKVPERARQQAYLTILSAHPLGNVFAAATVFSDRLDIFGDDGSLLASAPRFSPFEPSFAVRQGSQGPAMAANRNRHRFGYLGLATTAAAIYALYSGRSSADAQGLASYGAIVHQIGWDGQYQRAFVLDRDAFAIAVDRTGSTLFALIYQPVPAVVVYHLRAAIPGGVIPRNSP
jgi:TolB-like protein